MVSNTIVKFLVDRDQFERIKINASLKGFKTLSSYLREISLNPEDKILNKLQAIEDRLKENEKTN